MQDLLQKATEDEMKKIMKERRIFKALEAKFPTADEAPTQVSITHVVHNTEKHCK